MRTSNFRISFPLLAILLSLAVIPVSRVGANTTPQRFAGKFQNERLVVVISVDGTTCTGVITQGESRFPLNGTVEDGTLRGTFTSGSDKFDFTATLDGNELALTTAGATHRLKNANPLAVAAGSNPPPTPAVKPGDVVGKWLIVGNFGGEKFTLTLGPKGDMEVESSFGNSTSGPTYSCVDSVITFDGGTSINNLSLAGKWTLTWKDNDTFTTVDNQGKNLILHRVK